MLAHQMTVARRWCTLAGAVLALLIAAPGLAEAQAPITSTTSTSTSTTLPGTPTTSTTLPLPTSSIPASGGSTSSTTSTVPPTTTTTFVPNPARKWKGSTVELRGHGWGHGRGLGQYGSLGYATDEDIDYTAILDHYYGNTAKGTQPDGPITVRLTDMDNKNLLVTSGAQFTIGTSSFPAGGFGRIRRSGGTWLVEQGTTCSNTGVWTTLQTVPGDQQPTAQVVTDGGDDITKMLTVCGTNRRTYRGSVKAILNGTVPQAVNVVNMEQYLRGVVPRESPASWGDVDAGRGINALRAQAVSARSYAWAEQRNALYKTCDTTACQVYGGAGLNGVRIEDSRSDRAVAETATEVRILDGKVARTEFSSSTGGYTAGGTFPATPDAGDDTVTNPNHSWSATVGVGAVEAAFPTTGYLASIVVTDRNGLGEDGGRVLDVRVTGSAGSVTVSGEAFRSALKLKADWFRVTDPGLNSPAVAVAPAHLSDGIVFTSTTGEALAYGGMSDVGSMEGVKLNKPIVGVASMPTDKGYFMVATDGGIFTFGDAVFKGSTGAVKLNKPIVGMATTPSGNGYYLVASDGGIFTFGDAVFKGSTGAIKLAQPIVGMTVDPAGRGYWFVAADGGVFSYPSTLFQGSAGGAKVPAPIIGMATTPTGNGYWLVGRDGAIYDFGDAVL